MRLWKKRDEVKGLVFDHLAFVRETVSAFQDATRAYLVDKNPEKAADLAAVAHTAEAKADDVRRSIEKAMLSGALLPPSRRNILELVDRADTLANAAEASLDTLLIQRMIVPDDVISPLLEIVSETVSLYADVECGIESLFAGKQEETLKCADRIDQAEGRIDRIERRALKLLFSMDLDLAAKLHVARYIADLVKISDRAEDLADRLALIIAEGAY